MRFGWEGVLFEWDDVKARSNAAKHGVSFHEAATVFGDPAAGIVADEEHSGSEARFFIRGYSEQQRLLTVTYTERMSRIRIITARLATAAERRTYANTR